MSIHWPEVTRNEELWARMQIGTGNNQHPNKKVQVRMDQTHTLRKPVSGHFVP